MEEADLTSLTEKEDRTKEVWKKLSHVHHGRVVMVQGLGNIPVIIEYHETKTGGYLEMASLGHQEGDGIVRDLGIAHGSGDEAEISVQEI